MRFFGLRTAQRVCTMANNMHQDIIPKVKDDASGELQKSMKKSGRYMNPWPSYVQPSRSSVLKIWMTEKFPSALPSKQQLEERLPVTKSDLEALSKAAESEMQVTWIGHATVLIQMEGLNILTDPIFSERCSMSQWFGPKRYRPVPLTIQELPRIDAVVISHNHYDHLDLGSVQQLYAMFGDGIRWFVPAGLSSWMQSVGCDNVVEMDWWEEKAIPNKPEVKFAFVPAQHWCKRTAFDDNKVLWGGWCVIGSKQRFYFAGDTGYCTVFPQIGNKYGPFDLAAIPIGAYEPRWFMKSQHVNPADAVQIHIDVKAKKSLGIHWGTFSLSSTEGFFDPPIQVKREMEARGLPIEDFFTLYHGETTRIRPVTT